MVKKAIVDLRTNLVTNIIEIEDDASYQVRAHQSLVDYERSAEINGTYIDGVFTPPVRFPNLNRQRHDELKIKFKARTATLDEVQEFLADFV